MIEPVILTVPVPETHRETYLTIRLRQTQEVVSVIEVLSPANKRPERDGRREPLPEVPVPLERPDPDAVMDLQAVFRSVYDRAGYDYSLDYGGAVQPPWSEGDAPWVHEILAGRGGRR